MLGKQSLQNTHHEDRLPDPLNHWMFAGRFDQHDRLHNDDLTSIGGQMDFALRIPVNWAQIPPPASIYHAMDGSIKREQSEYRG